LHGKQDSAERYWVAMSGENVEIVRNAVDWFKAFMRDELSSDAYLESFDPEIELLWRDRQEYPDFPQHLRGAAEFIAFSEQYRERWADLVQEVLETIDVPDGRVLLLTRQGGRGRESGVPIVIHFFQLWTIRDGRVRRIEYFRHRADALEAAGLSD
jgi:ketosteroid isomerase-like protein